MMENQTLFDLYDPTPQTWHSSLCRCPRCLQPVADLTSHPASSALETNAGSSWGKAAAEWIRQQPRGRHITSEDVTAAVGFPRANESNRNNAVGALMRLMARRGHLRSIGYTTATNPQANGRALRVWEVQ